MTVLHDSAASCEANEIADATASSFEHPNLSRELIDKLAALEAAEAEAECVAELKEERPAEKAEKPSSSEQAESANSEEEEEENEDPSASSEEEEEQDQEDQPKADVEAKPGSENEDLPELLKFS